LNSNLTVDEEERVAQILAVITEKVQKRRLGLFPFFKPYDRVEKKKRYFLYYFSFFLYSK